MPKRLNYCFGVLASAIDVEIELHAIVLSDAHTNTFVCVYRGTCLTWSLCMAATSL